MENTPTLPQQIDQEIISELGSAPLIPEFNSAPPMPENVRPEGRWEPKTLRPRHREIMRRLLEGATYIEIAESMGITTQAIMLVATSQMFRDEMELMQEKLDFNVMRRAEDLSNEALDTLKGLMRSAKAQALQKSCAESILGIAGYSKLEKKIVGVVGGEDVIKALNQMRKDRILGTESDGVKDSG